MAWLKKVNISLKRDLEQQLKYYRSLGADGLTNDQLYKESIEFMQRGISNLDPKQENFARDIWSSVDMLRQIAQLEVNYKSGGPAPAELAPGALANPDTGKKQTDSPR